MFGLFKKAKVSPGPGMVPSQKFEIWLEGNPKRMDPAVKVGRGTGPTFNDAVKQFVDDVRGPASTMWTFDPSTSQWSFFGRKAYDNQKDARARCG